MPVVIITPDNSLHFGWKVSPGEAHVDAAGDNPPNTAAPVKPMQSEGGPQSEQGQGPRPAVEVVTAKRAKRPLRELDSFFAAWDLGQQSVSLSWVLPCAHVVLDLDLDISMQKSNTTLVGVVLVACQAPWVPLACAAWCGTFSHAANPRKPRKQCSLNCSCGSCAGRRPTTTCGNQCGRKLCN